MTARVRMEGGILVKVFIAECRRECEDVRCDPEECGCDSDPSDSTADRPEVPRQSAAEQQQGKLRYH